MKLQAIFLGNMKFTFNTIFSAFLKIHEFDVYIFPQIVE